MARKDSIFRKRDSDRSGMTYKKIQLVKDNGVLVGPEEFDTPPPSDVSLGGEGDISPGDVRGNSTTYTTPAGSQIRIQYITSGGGIQYEQKSYSSGEVIGNGYFYIVGSNSAVNVTADPQITRAGHGNKLTLEGIGSSVTLETGSGLSLRNIAVINSGFILNLIYSATDSLWYETSRSHRTEGF